MKKIIIITLILAGLLLVISGNRNLVQIVMQPDHQDTGLISRSPPNSSADKSQPFDVQSGQNNPPSVVNNSQVMTMALDSMAIESLRDRAVNGDLRTPQLHTTRQWDEQPSRDELEDPALYHQYEHRQQMRMYRAFVEASKTKVTELKQMIEQGKQEGVTDEEIEFARQKMAGIQQLAEQLQQDYPDIMDDDYAPAND